MLRQHQPQPDAQIVERETAEICDAVEAVVLAEDQAKAAVQHLIRLKFIAGQMLAKKRESAQHGEWMKWCEQMLPISYDTANRWIGLAAFLGKHGPEALDDAKSVRQAYQLAGLLPESQGGSGGGGATQSEDAYLTDLVRTNTRLSAQLAKRPLSEWAKEELLTLRERLRPFVDMYVELNAIAPA